LLNWSLAYWPAVIAAHALSLQSILVTDNVRDFVAYPGIQIENWLEEKLD
jgi:tRNA(fMet)-specific endonuclease VapC